MNRLLDTDICIYIIKRKPPQVLQRFSAFEPGEIGVSSITVAELYYGAEKSRHPSRNIQALEQFLMPLSIVEFGFVAAATYGRIRAHLESAGTPIGPMDLLIAAQALQIGVTLVTNNSREFTRIPGLTIENWVGD
ncbi:MAG: type II toxin-antitoxin system VapC family toxin [Armatimonadetes bacterium]|nr:type II toxin-antitoxin system VapC family toxin [Armatimonadota bacterium]